MLEIACKFKALSFSINVGKQDMFKVMINAVGYMPIVEELNTWETIQLSHTTMNALLELLVLNIHMHVPTCTELKS